MELSDRSLEAELAAIADHAEPGRTARLGVRHWGWDGRGGATLEATGRELGGLTRERVRQLCERLAAGLEPGTAAPALDAALVLAAHVVPTTARELGRRVADERLSAMPFDPEGLLSAAALLGRDATFSLATVKDVRVALPDPPDPSGDATAVIARVVDTARMLVRRAGAARVRDVTGAVAAELAVWVDDDLVTAVVSEPDDFVWLDRRAGWFYLPAVAKNAVVSRVAKVLSVAGAVTLQELHAGIRRDERMRDFVMPEYVLAELCQRVPGVRVEGDTVVGTRLPPPEEALETTELTIYRLLAARGGAADRRELEVACRETGMKASSFHNRMAYSPIIADLGHGRYGLRGLQNGDWPARGSGAGRSAAPTATAEGGAGWAGDLERSRPAPRR